MFIIYGGIFFPQILKPQVINNEQTLIIPAYMVKMLYVCMISPTVCKVLIILTVWFSIVQSKLNIGCRVSSFRSLTLSTINVHRWWMLTWKQTKSNLSHMNAARNPPTQLYMQCTLNISLCIYIYPIFNILT